MSFEGEKLLSHQKNKNKKETNKHQKSNKTNKQTEHLRISNVTRFYFQIPIDTCTDLQYFPYTKIELVWQRTDGSNNYDGDFWRIVDSF